MTGHRLARHVREAESLDDGLLQTLLAWETELRERGLKPVTTGEPAEDERFAFFAVVVAAIELRSGH